MAQRRQVPDRRGGRLPAGCIRWGSRGGPAAERCSGAYSTAQKNAGLGAADDLQNNDEGYYRRMPVNYGLYNSINTATFAEAAQLDFCGIQKMVDAVGLHSGVDNAQINMHQLGNLLGATGVAPLHLANAFATFANDGKYCAPIAIAGRDRRSGTEAPGRDQRLPRRRQARGGPRRQLRAAGRAETGSGVYIKPKVQDQVPGGGQDRHLQQQRRHLGGGLHVRPCHRFLLRRRPGGPETARPEHHHQRQVLQGHRRLHARRPAVGELHAAGRPRCIRPTRSRRRRHP